MDTGKVTAGQEGHAMEPRFVRWGLLVVGAVLLARSLHGEVTPAQVNSAIASGVAYLEKQQKPDGGWTEHPTEPHGGLSSLCTMALLNAGRTKDDPSVKRALAYLDGLRDPDRTYSVSLMIMAYAQADPKSNFGRINKLAKWLEAHQMKDGKSNGGWTYRGPVGGSADNSNSQFAILALHEAERAGVKIADQTWQRALNYWTQPGMQFPDGSFGYEPGRNASGSMTCAGIASLIMARDRLHSGDAAVAGGRVQCCGNQPAEDEVQKALAWMGQHFRVDRNPGGTGAWLLYYLYAVERVGRMSGQRYFIGSRRVGNATVPDPHDWYREGCEHLLAHQNKLFNYWMGAPPGENDQLVATSFALLFLSKGRRPVVMAKLKHQADGEAFLDWDHHRRAVQNLVMRLEKQDAWKRDLSWQTIDFSAKAPNVDAGRKAVGEQFAATAADLMEAPVLFLSGSRALAFSGEQKQTLKQYVENGGFLFVEACHGNGCNGLEFDRSFRGLMRELFPDSELRRLPPDHPVWYAEQKVDPKHLPKDPEFWLWGLDACCRTSVVYCPRSLSCYWELAHPYRESNHAAPVKEEIETVVRMGMNVVAYATGRELKDKLEKPQIAVSSRGGRSPRGALVVPKLSHGGGADDAPAALNNLLAVMERQLEMRVDYQKRVLPATEPKLLDNPIVFMHGRRGFRFSAAERKALKDYLDRGGFLFADAICANTEFADSLRAELKSIYPELQLARIPPSHPMFTDEFKGFNLSSVMLRDPQIRAEGDPLTAKLVAVKPLLEGLEVEGRLAVVLSPYDISCALEKGASLECKGYTPADAARIGANVLLYALQQ
jgi:hypothetical protein